MIINLVTEIDQEDDGRWLAEINHPLLKGCKVYGESYTLVRRNVQILALQILADLMQRGEIVILEDIKFSVPHPLTPRQKYGA